MIEKSQQGARRILSTTALMGGASVINVLLGMVRVKVLAAQLGPALFGMMSLYSNFISTIGSIASLGLGQSGVRDIAEAIQSGDSQKVDRKVAVLKRIVFITGVVGFIATLCLAIPGSRWVFGNYDHAWAIACLGSVVFLSQIQSGQSAILSGLRRIGDLAKINVIGGLLSTIFAIVLLWTFHADGVVPFLIAVAVGQLLASWWYARKIELGVVKISWRDCLDESREMVKLGLAMVVSGLAMTVSTIVILVIIRSYLGESEVGFYQSALTISSIYVGFILQGMSSDYFPRLVSVEKDQKLRNQAVSEQSEIAMLLAVPGLVAALMLSSVMILVLYSVQFGAAADILKWQVLGMLGRIISWPMGFLLLARGDKKAYMWCEISTAVLHVLLVWLAVQYWGVVGAGVGMAGEYIFYVLLIGCVTHVRHGYIWSRSVRNVIVVGSTLVLLTFASIYIAEPTWRYGVGALLLLVSALWSLDGLVSRLGIDHVVEVLRKMAVKLRLTFLHRALTRVHRNTKKGE